MTVLAEHDQEIRAAFGVMQAHIQALCEQDETAMSETLHFPHYRLSGAELKVNKERLIIMVLFITQNFEVR